MQTHEELRKLAVRWLSRQGRCSVILSEMMTSAGEIPDAIGWKLGYSILIECKASRSDYLRNCLKTSALMGLGMGAQRYYLCPKEMISLADVAMSDYGLLWVRGDGNVHVLKEAPRRSLEPPVLHNETLMLLSALRRIKTREYLTINIMQEGLSDGE